MERAQDAQELGMEGSVGLSSAAASNTVRRLRAAMIAEDLLQVVDDDAWEADDLSGILSHLRKAVHCAHNLDDLAPEAWTRVAAEIGDSLVNERKILAHARLVLFPRVQEARRRHGTTWQWLCSLSSYDEVLRECERLASIHGHPTHPMSKMRRWADRNSEHGGSLSPFELSAWGPEYGSPVALPLVAIVKAACRTFHSTSEPEGASYSRFVARHFPAPYEAWRRALSEHGVAPDDYYPLPVHPASMSLLLSAFGGLVRSGVLLPVHLMTPNAESLHILATPMMSVRTMLPCADGSQPSQPRPPMVKLPIPLRCTSLVRYVSPVEVSEGPILSDTFIDFVGRSKLLRTSLAIVPEAVGLHGSEHVLSYEDARFISVLFRASAATVAEEGVTGHLHVPLAAYLSTPAGPGSEPLAVELARAAPSSRDHFAHHVGVTLRAALGMYARYGVTLELHQQNAVLEIGRDDGMLRRVVCREVAGGAYCDEKMLVALGTDLRPLLHARQDALCDTALAFSMLWHSTFTMHLMALAATLGEYGLLSWADALDIVRSEVRLVLQAVREEASAVEREPAITKVLDHVADTESRLLDAGEVPQKALLLMRLQGTKAEQFVATPNPLTQGPEVPVVRAISTAFRSTAP